jgi:quercetin dioxygenase-like cupin family protein
MRCIRLWTDSEGISRFEEGGIVLKNGSPVNLLSEKFPTKSISFAETQAGQLLDWHNAPTKQFVITLRGTLDFWNKLDEHFVITPGDILLAEDVTGSGHSWKLIGDDPWRRVYVILETNGDLSFIKNIN